MYKNIFLRIRRIAVICKRLFGKRIFIPSTVNIEILTYIVIFFVALAEAVIDLSKAGLVVVSVKDRPRLIHECRFEERTCHVHDAKVKVITRVVFAMNLHMFDYYCTKHDCVKLIPARSNCMAFSVLQA